MNESLLSQALGSALKPRDFYKEAVSRIERKLVTEGYNLGNGEDDEQSTLEVEEHLKGYNEEIDKLSEHSKELDDIVENFDNINDLELANRINAIEPNFSDNKVTLLTESFTPDFRRRAKLVCEDMDKRVKISLIALIVAATLKLITWIIDFFKKANKNKKKPKSASERARERKAETERRAKSKKEFINDTSYDFYSETIRDIMGEVMDYCSTGNARSLGENVDGIANLFMQEMLDYIDSLKIPSNEKRRITENSLRVLSLIINRGISIGWFGFNPTVRKIIARELVDYDIRGQQPPISPTLAHLTTIVSHDPAVDAMWTSNDKWKNNEVRLLTAWSATDLMIFCMELSKSMQCVRQFFRGYEANLWLSNRGKATYGEANRDFEFDNAATAAPTRTFLNTRIPVDDEEWAKRVAESAINLAKDATIEVNSSSRVSTPVKYTPFKVGKIEGAKSGSYIIPVETEFVSPSAYREVENFLNRLGRSDGLIAFTDLFFEMHGDYSKDNIETRLQTLVGEFYAESMPISDKLKVLKNELKDIKDLLDMQADERKRYRAKPDEVFVFDLKFELDRIGLGNHGDSLRNVRETTSIGTFLSKLISLHQRAVKGWSGHLTAVERMVMRAKKLDV